MREKHFPRSREEEEQGGGHMLAQWFASLEKRSSKFYFLFLREKLVPVSMLDPGCAGHSESAQVQDRRVHNLAQQHSPYQR